MNDESFAIEALEVSESMNLALHSFNLVVRAFQRASRDRVSKVPLLLGSVRKPPRSGQVSDACPSSLAHTM